MEALIGPLVEPRIAAAGFFAGGYVPRAQREEARQITIPLKTPHAGPASAPRKRSSRGLRTVPPPEGPRCTGTGSQAPDVPPENGSRGLPKVREPARPYRVPRTPASSRHRSRRPIRVRA
ncbi:hypothetical protein GCM10010360_10030 [Streptomyces nogalater]